MLNPFPGVKAGEMLKENNEIKPGGDRKSSLHDERMKLKDLGISEIQSHRWQREAELPEEELEQHIQKIKNERGFFHACS